MSGVFTSINFRRAGWLDRVVEFYKKNFIQELQELPSIKIKAKIERAPPGYVDSTDWDYESVLRLLTLIRDSEDAKPVRRALRRVMRSSRRFMSVAQSFKNFPSLAKDHPNYFYYDVDSGEYFADLAPTKEYVPLEDDDVIFVTNPVEARLPSARISVKLLRAILENRAKAGRVVPPYTKSFSWLPINKTSVAHTTPAGAEVEEAKKTTVEGAATTSTNAGGTEATTAAAAAGD